MKKRLICILSVFISIVLFCNLWNYTSARSYPIKTLTINDCSAAACTLELPKITNAQYYTYKSNYVYRKIYSMLRLSTYYWSRDVWEGSHQWVDIACAKWTPVYAAYDWTVIVAWEKWNRWNVIVIQHECNNQIYYTVYAHLSEINVKFWDFVTEWLKIWEVWDTWNATWPHLHFQIEINQDWNHPYFPSWCDWTIGEIVNEWLCINQIRKNTVDPIVFLEQTTKLNSSMNQTKNPLYTSSNEIQLSGFVWWFMNINSLTEITISKSESWWDFLSSPITISASSWYLNIAPSKINVLAGERTVFMQSLQKTGFAIVTVKYWTKTLNRFPVLIWTDEDIEKWYENKKLIKALQALWVKV